VRLPSRAGGAAGSRSEDFALRYALMSLNRTEQMIHDYLLSRTEELRYWQDRVRREAKQSEDPHAAAASLERGLWAYYEERAAVAEPFRSVVRREGLRRTSLRNLAELLLRLWAPPPAPKNAAPPPRREWDG
jgi:hypothetical protein